MKRLLLLIIIVSTLITSCGSSKKASSNTKPAPVAVVVTPPKNVSTKEKKPKKSKKDPYISKHLRKLNESDARYDPMALFYIDNYGDIAMEEMRVYKIPASITIAQGMLESGNGRSTLATKSNNHFGVKCHKGWSGDKVYHDDDEAQECFRKYKYVHTSYKDHSLFLSQRSRYDVLFDLDENDYRGWAHGLKKQGYATDPKYAYKLIDLIELYQLQNFDAEVLGKKPVEYKRKAKSSSSSSKSTKKSNKKSKNKSKYGFHVVQKGETLYGISKMYDLTVEDLKKMNKLKSNDLEIGQALRVEGKKSSSSSKKETKQTASKSPIKYKNGWHTVQKGETLYSISRQYGMTVEDLKKVNKLKSNELTIGMNLKVNEKVQSKKSANTHTVKKGETLYSISRQYGISVEALKKKNKLKSNEISIGQELEIK
ncbi:MAG: LysM peptidoglycan-binding domain-containing protein [Flavobacteriaceae bacterium]